MSTTLDIRPFEGTSWEECNSFIRSIRAAAWQEGKLRDKAWIADFASLSFSNDALKWHSRLPPEVQEDWAKLEVALVDRWSMENEDDGLSIQPTPAAALSEPISGNFDRARLGVLKVVIGGSAPLYLAGDGRDRCTLTGTIGNALRIRLSPQTASTIMEVTKAPYHCWVGIHWHQETPLLEQGSTDYAKFSLVKSQDLCSSYRFAKGPVQLAMVDLLKDGHVLPQWHQNGEKTCLSAFVTGDILFLAPDPIAHQKSFNGRRRATLLFEELD